MDGFAAREIVNWDRGSKNDQDNSWSDRGADDERKQTQ